MERKVVGISSNLVFENDGTYSKVAQNYIDSIYDAGALAIILPISTDKDVIKSYVNKIDGLLLSGGYDINPLLYNQNPHRLLNDTLPIRDEFELSLLNETCKQGKPVLGICRGLQLINIGFGGTLYQDISLAPFETLKHNQDTKGFISTQIIDLFGILKDTLQKDNILINSLHHQAIDKLAKGFIPVAYSKDGIIEAIFFSNENLWLLGIQWNPEIIMNDINSRKIFKLFIDQLK